MTVPPELTSSALTALALLGTWFAAYLARKGKREDTKIALTNLTFTQMQELAEARLAEIQQLRTALTDAEAGRERVRISWETRWDQQLARCRAITEPLVQAITKLRAAPTADAERAAVEAVQQLDEHRFGDHGTTS